ncbi:MAG TPA: phosphotransferase, partial [bacterium]|nr:phosphotransferase [bacterium]
PFDGAIFERELLMFLETVAPRGPEKTWRELFARVTEAALEQPFCFCHRDYHSRNLMVVGKELKVLDFQDCRAGPYTYDPVSLAYDPYVSRNPDRSRRVLEGYFSLRPRFLRGISLSEFERDCDTMSLQRLLKAAGTYGKVFRATGNRVFLRYLDRAREWAREIVVGRAEFRGYSDLFRNWEPLHRGAAEESV